MKTMKIDFWKFIEITMLVLAALWGLLLFMSLTLYIGNGLSTCFGWSLSSLMAALVIKAFREGFY